ncbi:MAG: glycosyltransferase [Bacteroidota bacterium]|nr:glycosyltransferase [Bacteroidota bacterium]
MSKIVLIIPSLRSGGAERVMSLLANTWADNSKFEIYLIILTDQKIYYQLSERVIVLIPRFGYRNNLISKFFYTLRLMGFIRKSLSKIQPLSVLSFCERYNNLVLLATLGSKFGVFVSDRGNPYRNIGLFNDRLRRVLYGTAKGIISQTNESADFIRKFTSNQNVIVIPNPLRRLKDVEVNKSNIVLYVGRFEQNKNQIDLIHAFASSENQDWKLRFVGEGEKRDFLLQEAKKLGIERQVQFFPFTSDIDRHFSEARIFAFTSLEEGFPNVLIEALGHGLACISYDCPVGPADIISQTNGLLIENGNKEEFGRQLKKMMADEHYLSKLKPDRLAIRHRYYFEKITTDYLNFITKS